MTRRATPGTTPPKTVGKTARHILRIKYRRWLTSFNLGVLEGSTVWPIEAAPESFEDRHLRPVVTLQLWMRSDPHLTTTTVDSG